MKKYFIFIFVIIFSFSCSGNSRQINPIFSKELISVRKQSVVTHTELQNLNKTIKILDLEILRNKQNQLILRKNIENEESFAENMIFLLQENYFKSSLSKFLKNIENNNYISNKALKENLLEIIKEDVNEYLNGLSEIKSLEEKLEKKIYAQNIEKKKLKLKQKKLDSQLNKISKLQFSNSKNNSIKKKEMILKKKAKNIDELFTGVATNNQKKINLSEKNRIKFPVEGNIISKFGERKEAFPLKNGLMIEITDAKYVISPINGIVKFAGKFMNYGNLIIIENKGSYHSILSGMDEIITDSGNKVLKGQPIGKNYFKKLFEKKKIYFELRYKGKSIDPKREVEIL